MNSLFFKSKILVIVRLILLVAVIMSAFAVSSCANTQTATAKTIMTEPLQDSKNIQNTASESTTANTAGATLSEADQEKIKMDQELKDAAQTSDISGSGDASPDGVNYSLLVICPQEFILPAQKLISHKNNTGISARMVTLEAVYNTYQGKDEAEKVKKCLVDYSMKSGLKYTILVGDSDKFPVRYTKAECGNEQLYGPLGLYFPTLFFPSDLYYADLYMPDGETFADWDANKNGYYGELIGDRTPGIWNVDNLDYTPEIAVGRLPVSNIDEADVCVTKVIDYETNAAGAQWTKNIMFISNRYQDGYCKVNSELAVKYFSDFNILKLNAPAGISEEERKKIEADIAGGGQKQDIYEETTYKPDPEIVVQYINDGLGIIGYAGHGGPREWCWSINDDYLNKLTNANMYPVIFANACLTAQFSNAIPVEPYIDINGIEHIGSKNGEDFDPDNPPQPACIQTQDFDGLGQNFVTKSMGGAVTYIGFITIGESSNYSTYNDFFKVILEPDKLLGDSFNQSFRNLVNDYLFKKFPENVKEPYPGNVNVVQQPLTQILFGDPSLRVGGIK